MRIRDFALITLIPAALLLVPLVAMQFTSEVNWTAGDIIAAWVLLAGAGFAYKLVTHRTGHLAYRAAAGLGVATALLLVWGNLAVGFIGDEGNPANLLYLGVLLIGVVGATVTRFRAHGMALTLYAMAFAQLLVPLFALIIWQSDIPWLVFGLNTVFALLFAASAALFRFAVPAERAPVA
ncbi:MAG: hypothetical protein KF897_12460 [Opitutaceae bacterium]|nr:hypothetical protein [Opitutaceae bacterium]